MPIVRFGRFRLRLAVRLMGLKKRHELSPESLSRRTATCVDTSGSYIETAGLRDPLRSLRCMIGG